MFNKTIIIFVLLLIVRLSFAESLTQPETIPYSDAQVDAQDMQNIKSQMASEPIYYPQVLQSLPQKFEPISQSDLEKPQLKIIQPANAKEQDDDKTSGTKTTKKFIIVPPPENPSWMKPDAHRDNVIILKQDNKIRWLPSKF